MSEPTKPRGRLHRSGAVLRRLLATAAISLLAACCLLHGGWAFSGPKAAEMRERGDALSARIDKLVVRDELLDSLHFGWFDRPYARATLATVVKTSEVLRREGRLRAGGNGAIPDSMLTSMFLWTDDALGRVLMDEPDGGFRPHRMCFAAGDIAGGTAPPLFAFLDAATATRNHADFGDLDLLAALGQRVYVRWAKQTPESDTAQTLVQRAGYVGMPLAIVESYNATEAATQSLEFADDILRIRGATLRDLASRTDRDSPVLRAVVDSLESEDWDAWLARRGLARGASGNGSAGYLVLNWGVPVPSWAAEEGEDSVRAAMWVDAFQGLSLGVLAGWRDLRDGSMGDRPSLYTLPRRIETVSRTALDILRFQEAIQLVRSRPPVVLTVPQNAVDSADPNRWADWIMPLFGKLVQMQVPFDVAWNPPEGGELGTPYALQVSVRRADAVDWNAVVGGVERELTTQGWSSKRLGVHNGDGSSPADVFVRTGVAGSQGETLAVVNLSGAPRVLYSSRGRSSRRLHDVLDGTLIGRDGRFTLDPWQVRLFVPR